MNIRKYSNVDINNKTVLVVLGMHRSGTSAISGILDLLEFNSGSSLLPPQPDNPKGFFENQRIVDFNEKCLAHLGASWSKTFLLDDTWWENDTLSELTDELGMLLKEELGFLNRSFLKDPRLCVLLPIYLKVFREMEITPYFIVCLRNPSEIAQSLKKRNYFSDERTILLWLDYMFKAEIYSRNYLRILVDFNTLVLNPLATVENILNEFGYSMEIYREKFQEIVLFIQSSLKHNNNSVIEETHHYIAEIDLFYQSLIKLKEDGGSLLTYRTIDNLRRSFYKKYTFFHALSHAVESRFKSVQGSKENIDIVENVKMGVNLLNFDLDCYGDINKLIFIPANTETCCLFNSISVMDKDGMQIPFKAKFGGHTSVGLSELMVYKHVDFFTLFEFEPPLKIETIRLTVTYYAFGASVKELKITPDTSITSTLGLLQRELHSLLLSNEEKLINPGAVISEYNNRLVRVANRIQEQLEIINQLSQEVSLLSKNLKNITEQNNRFIDLSASKTSCLNMIQVKDLHVKKLESSWTRKVGKVILLPVYFIFLRIFVPVKSKIQARLKI